MRAPGRRDDHRIELVVERGLQGCRVLDIRVVLEQPSGGGAGRPGVADHDIHAHFGRDAEVFATPPAQPHESHPDRPADPVRLPQDHA